MKKKVLLLTAVAILFCGLWLYEIFDKSDTKELCQEYANRVSSSFGAHEMLEDQNKDSSNPLANYWIGVSRFYAFSETLRPLVGYENTLYQECSSLYHHMITSPDDVLLHMFELTVAMDKLSEDYADSEGWKIIADLNDLFQHGEYPQ